MVTKAIYKYIQDNPNYKDSSEYVELLEKEISRLIHKNLNSTDANKVLQVETVNEEEKNDAEIIDKINCLSKLVWVSDNTTRNIIETKIMELVAKL